VQSKYLCTDISASVNSYKQTLTRRHDSNG
jgi:hypothetical protein